MFFGRAIVALIAALACVCGRAQGPYPGRDASKIQVLLLTGYNSTPNHHWREIDPKLREILDNTGRYEVRVDEEPRGLTADTLAGYQVLLIDYSDYTPSLGPTWPEETRQAYLRYLQSGGGVVAFHVVVGSFPEWPEFHKTLGIADNRNISHGPYHDFLVNVVDPGNPIMRNIPTSFAGWGEIYNGMVLSPGANVLAQAWDDPNNCSANRRVCGSGKREPMMWTYHYGAGRIFVTTLGHDLRSISSPEFQMTLVHGADWTVNRNVG